MRFQISFFVGLIAAFLVVAEDKRPNIIFLMSDDQAVRTMGCYGAPGVQTPNLDRLGADGMIFDAHYDTTAICMASRANVMTGMFEYKTGCNFEHGTMLEKHWRRSYPVLLRKAGYRTAFAGKFGFEVLSALLGNDISSSQPVGNWALETRPTWDCSKINMKKVC